MFLYISHCIAIHLKSTENMKYIVYECSFNNPMDASIDVLLLYNDNALNKFIDNIAFCYRYFINTISKFITYKHYIAILHIK